MSIIILISNNKITYLSFSIKAVEAAEEVSFETLLSKYGLLNYPFLQILGYGGGMNDIN